MKKWIVKNWIALAEVFDWKVPAWVRGLVDENEFEAFNAAERDLTDALKRSSPEEHEMPAFLEAKITRGIIESEDEPRRINILQGLLVPSAMLAAVVVIGFVLVYRPGAVDQTEAPQQVAPMIASSSANSDAIENFADQINVIEEKILEEEIFVNPLVSEGDRLKADLTNAMRFVAKSFTPDQFLKEG
ncbi:MAG: hypothetical protein AB3N63_16905 [Puniceicoccaceae bacterium]